MKSLRGFFMACRAWQITWGCKSVMENGSYQPLAGDKDIRCAVEGISPTVYLHVI